MPNRRAASGERGLSDPGERRGAVSWTGVGTTLRTLSLTACHRETAWSCEGQRTDDATNRMHLTCTS